MPVKVIIMKFTQPQIYHPDAIESVRVYFPDATRAVLRLMSCLL